MSTGTYCNVFANIASGNSQKLTNGFGYIIGLEAGGATTWYFADGNGNQSLTFDAPFNFPNGRGPIGTQPGQEEQIEVFCVTGALTIIQTPV